MNSSSHYNSWLYQPLLLGAGLHHSPPYLQASNSEPLCFLYNWGSSAHREGVYRRLGGVYGPGSRTMHGQAIDSYTGSRATLQGYSASHYTFLVYRQTFPSTCKVTVHSTAPLMTHSYEYSENLWTNYTQLHMCWSKAICTLKRCSGTHCTLVVRHVSLYVNQELVCFLTCA